MQVSRGKTRDLRPIHPSQLRPVGLDDIGLPTTERSRPPTIACMRFVCLGPGLCLQLPPHVSSRPRFHAQLAHGSGRASGVIPPPSAVAVRLGVPVIKVSRGLSPPSHFPVGFRLPVLTPTSASAPCPAHSGSPGVAPGAPTDPDVRNYRIRLFRVQASLRDGRRCGRRELSGVDSAPGACQISSTTSARAGFGGRATSARRAVRVVRSGRWHHCWS